jgi:hypothetical protein
VVVHAAPVPAAGASETALRAVATGIAEPTPDPGPASSSVAVAVADVAAAVAFALAALLVASVVVTGEAGPYGGALVLAVFAALVGLAPAAVAVGLRLARRRGGPFVTGRWVVAALGALVLAVVLLPVGDALRERREERRADDLVDRLDVAARRCATSAVAAVPDETDPPSGASVRPQLTDRFHACVQRAAGPIVDQLSCTPAGCFTTLVDLTHLSQPTVIVDSPTYLDAELRRQTGARYDRTGRGVRLRRPPGAGGTFRTERGD